MSTKYDQFGFSVDVEGNVFLICDLCGYDSGDHDQFSPLMTLTETLELADAHVCQSNETVT